MLELELRWVLDVFDLLDLLDVLDPVELLELVDVLELLDLLDRRRVEQRVRRIPLTIGKRERAVARPDDDPPRLHVNGPRSRVRYITSMVASSPVVSIVKGTRASPSGRQ